jgi:A/G-specific adenine glycosylase
MPSAEEIRAYRASLVAWYRKAARDLPWRREPTAYRVWVSEVMLQQTRVEAVRGHYGRFLQRFPDLRALAEASEEEVLELWSGLGYYRRARALLAGARFVLERHGGEFPAAEEDALEIPGIGRYTSGAIRSIALGERAPVVDGNVARVLTRYFAVRGVVSRAAVAGGLWKIAALAVVRGVPGEVNQAQMELGALVCTPASPDCGRCPLASRCAALAQDLVGLLPELPPKRSTVELERTVLLVRQGERVLLRRRRHDELSPGLWDLPGAFTGAGGDRSGGLLDVERSLPVRVTSLGLLGTVRHAVTYRRIVLRVREARAVRTRAAAPQASTGGLEEGRTVLSGRDGAEYAWFRARDALGKAVSSPARRILLAWGATRPASEAAEPVRAGRGA